MNIRNVNESDYETIQQLDFMMGLRMQWDSAYHKEDQFVSVNDEGEIIGAASLFWDGTWYYLNKKDVNLPLYRMQIDIPEYRRKGIGREVLYTALKSIQEQKGEVATLTVVGDNKDAIAMYVSMGYSLMENMMEMHYILD